MSGKGLEGVIVAQTSRSSVDGQNGVLIYNGYDILDLGQYTTYDEVMFLLWNSHLPSAEELADFLADMGGRRSLPDGMITMLQGLPKDGNPVAMLRTAVSALALFDNDEDNIKPEAALEKSRTITAAIPTIIAAWERIRNGKEPIAPRADLSHAANFLYMLHGTEPSPEAIEVVDKYLVLLADHGFNASTFSARVTTGTLADVYSAITTAIGTLKGPSHGGATQKAMEQFISAYEAGVDDWYKESLETGRRIMGIGHRVYKVEDPRVKILRPLAQALAETSGDRHWFDTAYRIEQLARADEYFIERELYPNVDYYAAPVLYMIGIPLDTFTSMFAMSRVVGWTAHVLEQLVDNRLIRPRGEYVGPRGLKIEK